MQAECPAVSAAAKGSRCELATWVIFCSEGLKQNGHRRLQNGTGDLGSASWRSSDAARADSEVGDDWRRYVERR